MYDIKVDITTEDACLYMCPDGFHRFRLSKNVCKHQMAGLLWGSAYLYIPFFSMNKITRFIVHRDGHAPLSLPAPISFQDDVRLCAYMGRVDCMQFGEDPRHELVI